MITPLRLAQLSVFTVSLLAVCSPPWRAIAQTQSAREAIAAMNKEFEAAHLKGDAKTIAMQYSKDALSFREGKATVKGRDAIEQMWKEDIGNGGRRATARTTELHEAGDWAYETGEFKAMGTDGSVVYGGNYLLIWKREDGKWKIYREIGTSDPALKGTGLRAEIEAAEQRLLSAFNKRDAAAVAAMYAADAQSLPPDNDVLKGRDQIESFWKKALGPDSPTQKIEALEVLDLGEFANEQGKYILSDSAGHPVEEGKYMVVWKREDGRWKVFRETWNSKPSTTRP